MSQNSFCNVLHHEFNPTDRTRGDSYYQTGRVSIQHIARDLVAANVRGSGHRRYDVEVEFDESKRTVCSTQCSCPQFNLAGCCKHVWAVLRTLDASLSGNSGASAKPKNSRTSAASPSNSTRPFQTQSQASGVPPTQVLTATSAPTTAPWQRMLDSIQRGVADVRTRAQGGSSGLGATVVPFFIIDLSIQESEWPILQVHLQQAELPTHGWHRNAPATREELVDCEDELDAPCARIFRDLINANPDDEFEDFSYSRYSSWQRRNPIRHDSIDWFVVDEDCRAFLLREIVQTGRLFWRANRSAQPEPVPVHQWETEFLQAQIVLSDESNDVIRMSLQIVAGDQTFSASEIAWVWESGLVLLPDLLGEVDSAHIPWLLHFMQQGDQTLAADQRDGMIHSLLSIESCPKLVMPGAWGLTDEPGVPQAILKIKWPETLPRNIEELRLGTSFAFRYGGNEVPIHPFSPRQFFDPANKRLLARNGNEEGTKLKALLRQKEIFQGGSGHSVAYSDLTALPGRLRKIGWELEAEGRPLVPPGKFSLEVTSGLDWFDLSGGATYAEQVVPLPVLLQAVRRKENFVRLDDGAHGMLPTEWIEKFGKFLDLANHEGDALRFGKSQALLLDSLLAEQEQKHQISTDAGFRRFRKQLAAFSGIKPRNQPRAFQGELREYQRDGLGWFGFLRDFGLGGCLADDMGLGKTIQVLALLEHRRSRRLKKDEVRKPSLVVVPKSLIFNWIEEAARFSPKLDVVDYTGISRNKRVDLLATCDIVLTTYGTLRQDIETLSAIEYDYAILDEAQAIKNPKTTAAKSSFLLRADHRLTMTGTPIENHLGELWSQFRFLNPGLLGHSQAFASFNRADCSSESLQQLSRAIRPFILRRTKSEVLKELPDKTEQTLWCEMSPKQSRQYNELRDHYRIKLGKTVRELGIKKSKIHVLEALLRLRQAACDGRLVNPRQGARGAKMDLLLEQLEEVMGEGHKALVFSQFTSLLGLLEKDLKQKKIRYEYLDGKTNDRKSPVNRFQKDEESRLFLISLKAGGHGLNLTAADYVYILDPWWNPAVEAQAIDRAHRIGQTKNVFAYRMIAKGTVEEKIVELQKTKRELADSIISGNNSLIRSLTAADLQMLLG